MYNLQVFHLSHDLLELHHFREHQLVLVDHYHLALQVTPWKELYIFLNKVISYLWS